MTRIQIDSNRKVIGFNWQDKPFFSIEEYVGDTGFLMVKLCTYSNEQFSSATMKRETFLNLVEAMWPENVAYQFKQEDED